MAKLFNQPLMLVQEKVKRGWVGGGRIDEFRGGEYTPGQN